MMKASGFLGGKAISSPPVGESGMEERQQLAIVSAPAPSLACQLSSMDMPFALREWKPCESEGQGPTSVLCSGCEEACAECGKKVSLAHGEGAIACNDCRLRSPTNDKALLKRLKQERDGQQKEHEKQVTKLENEVFLSERRILEAESQISELQDYKRDAEIRMKELKAQLDFLRKWDTDRVPSASAGYVLLRAGDQTVAWINRFVLESRSCVYRELLALQGEGVEELQFGPLPGDVMNNFIHFLHTAEVKEEEVLRRSPQLLLEAAIKYGVVELKPLCMKHICWGKDPPWPLVFPSYSANDSEVACQAAIFLFKEAEQRNLPFVRAALLAGLRNPQDQTSLLDSASYAKLVAENVAMASKISGMLQQCRDDKNEQYVIRILKDTDIGFQLLVEKAQKKQRV